ncbi:5424_t:CDS:2 [Acaulospora colombiana]|uniref:5424_t:CDS:1 n=1 Tax=Acaulospora colombiana TaxID=27376 RepID=A0ACA9MDU9_9GLOM|nr:5424_t:CDS:2 [Acaulospora colombiana]
MEEDVALKTSPSALKSTGRTQILRHSFSQILQSSSTSVKIPARRVTKNEGGNQEIVAQTNRKTRSVMSGEHPKLIISLVRHGETEENRKKIIQGQLDTSLNALGHRQAELVAEALQSIPFRQALSSDLNRAVQTAEAILKSHNLPLQKQSLLREKAEGLPWGTKVRDKGESHTEFRKRIMGWWKQTIPTLLAESLEDDSDTTNILIVGHGAFLRCLMEALVDVGYSAPCLVAGKRFGSIPNTGVTTVHVYDDHYGDIVTYGEMGHLQRLVEDDSEEIVKESGDDLETRRMGEENQ